MIVSCPSCGGGNPGWARRCAKCGAALDAPAAPAEPPPAQAADPAPRTAPSPAWQPFERARTAPANLADLLSRAPAGKDPLTELAPPTETEPRLPDWGEDPPARTSTDRIAPPTPEPMPPEPMPPEPESREPRLPEAQPADPTVAEPKLGSIDSKPPPIRPKVDVFEPKLDMIEPRVDVIEPKLAPAESLPEPDEPRLRVEETGSGLGAFPPDTLEPRLGEVPAPRRPIGGDPRLGDLDSPVVRRARPAPAIELPARRSPAWLAPLLVLLVLAAGVGAFLAVWMSAPEGGGGGIDFGELAARARARLIEWGLIAR